MTDFKELIRENGKNNIRPAVAIGEVFKNKKGLDFEIVQYVTSNKVKIKFVKSGFEAWSAVKEIKKGSIRDWIATPLLPAATYIKTGRKRKPALEVGQILENFYGCKYEVIELVDGNYCKIKFLDSFGYEKVVLKSDAKRGIRNPYRKSVAGVGYIGEGVYNSVTSSQLFMVWSNMLTRCYDEESLKKHITYVGCSVEDTWHCFQDFATWCEAQPEFMNNRDWCLDKDIIERGNKIYSPHKCSFVPTCINNLFTLRGNKRGEYPLGVHQAPYGRFVAQINRDNKRVCLGRFDTPEETFLVYKSAKEEVIKKLATDYKGIINNIVYESLINWKVEVTD